MMTEKDGDLDRAWMDGWINGAIAMGCLFSGVAGWEERRDEYLTVRARTPNSEETDDG